MLLSLAFAYQKAHSRAGVLGIQLQARAAMKITEHLTHEVFARYVDVLRERLARSRDYVRGLRAKSKVTPLRQPATSAEQRVAR